MDTKELELTNTGDAPYRLRDADNVMVTIPPGGTMKVNVSTAFADRLSKWSDRGSMLTVGMPAKGSKAALALEAKSAREKAAQEQTAAREQAEREQAEKDAKEAADAKRTRT
jgi:hypothetical protein